MSEVQVTMHLVAGLLPLGSWEFPAEFLEFLFRDLVCVFLQDEFSAVITKALMTLVHGLETKFDAEMAAMTRVPWSALESVGDQSEYAFINLINLLNLYLQSVWKMPYSTVFEY